MKTQDLNSNPSATSQKAASVSDMTVGSPLRQITKFALPLILGYILQQMYLVIDAVIVGRWIGVGALAAVGASTSITFLIMGFCNGACAGFAIPVAQAFGAKDYHKMRVYVANAVRISPFHSRSASTSCRVRYAPSAIRASRSTSSSLPPL